MRTVYGKICIDIPDILNEERFSLSFRAINDLPSSKIGIFPTTVMYGIFPKRPGSGKRGSMLARTHVVWYCKDIFTEMKVQHNLKEAKKI